MKRIKIKLKLLLIIGASVFITGQAFAQDNIYVGAGAHITIVPGTTVTGGDLDLDGTLNIQSTSGGSGSLIVTSTTSTNGTGTANVQRYLPSDQWYIVSSPADGQDWKVFADNALNSIDKNGNNTKYGLASYNEAVDEWDYFSTSGTGTDFVAAKGYSAKRAALGVVTFTGDNIIAANTNINISKDLYGWNAVGNPYTSAIWVKENAGNNFLTVNTAVIEDAYEGLYIWDQSLAGGADYTVIGTGLPTFPYPGGEVELDQDKIAVGQGFIIRSIDGGGAVQFTSAMKVHATETEALFKSAEKSIPAIRLTVTSGDLANNTIVSFRQESTDGLDPGYDVGKLKGNTNIALFTQLVDGSSNVDFMYQSVPNVNYQLLTIPVGLDLANGGEISFTLETTEGIPYDMQVYLEDRALNITTQLDVNDAVYTVSVPGLKGYGRFYLLFSNSSTSIDTGLGVKNEFNAFTRDRLIFVNGPADRKTRFSVYSIDGKMWYQNRAEAINQNTIDASGFAAGVYLIKIDKQSGSQILKVVLSK